MKTAALLTVGLLALVIQVQADRRRWWWNDDFISCKDVLYDRTKRIEKHDPLENNKLKKITKLNEDLAQNDWCADWVIKKAEQNPNEVIEIYSWGFDDPIYSCDPGSGSVCGFDFETYDNECAAARVGVQHAGACGSVDLRQECMRIPHDRDLFGDALAADHSNLPAILVGSGDPGLGACASALEARGIPPQFCAPVCVRLCCVVSSVTDLLTGVALQAQAVDPVAVSYLNEKYGEDLDCTEPPFANFRSEDGVCNQQNAPLTYSGMANLKFGRYDRQLDLDNEIVNPEDPDDPEHWRLQKPNPREVSNLLYSDSEFRPSPVAQNGLVLGWVNFFVHDFLNHELDPYDMMAIKIPKDDPSFDCDREGQERYINVPRTKPAGDIQGESENRREYRNKATAWWDLSHMYGDNREFTLSIRSMENGHLKVQGEAPLGPFPVDAPRAYRQTNPDAPNNFNFGDPRSHTFAAVQALGTLWWNEHNHVADLIRAQEGIQDDETLFQLARLVVNAEFAKIHSLEWTNQITDEPSAILLLIVSWLGGPVTGFLTHLQSGGQAKVPPANPQLTHVGAEEFVALYKWHAMMNEDGLAVLDDGSEVHYNVIDSFRNTAVIREVGYRAILRGTCAKPAGSFRPEGFPAKLRNLVHSNVDFTSDYIGIKDPTCENVPVFDMVATDIMRERERAIPRYNQFRRILRTGFPETRYFSDFYPDNPEKARVMAGLYDYDIEAVDLFVGVTHERLYLPEGIPTSVLTGFLPFALNRVILDRFYNRDFTIATYTPTGIKRIIGDYENPAISQNPFFGAYTGTTMPSLFVEQGVVQITDIPTQISDCGNKLVPCWEFGLQKGVAFPAAFKTWNY